MSTLASILVLALVSSSCSSGNSTRAGSAAPAALALPPGWLAASTGPAGPLASWEARDEPQLGRVLALARTNHASSATYNLLWSAEPPFADGSLEVELRADAGEIDQGGGLAWRIQDARNYYVCRFNPLESNLRVYVVKDGERHQLASAEVAGAAGRWYGLRIEHAGTRITCALDGRELLAVDDAALSAPGGIGLWTKADARTSFAGLQRVDR
jgi:hypothetical protein